jgi:exodeoxyribonuclease V alpha subunit
VRLAATQVAALLGISRSGLAVLTGGPGTGKTTIVRTFAEQVLRAGGQVALAAPTGRAARRMQEATGIVAKTVHRLLEFDPRTGKFLRGRGLAIEASVIVVDEASMLDTALAVALLEAVGPESQLVLVGDEEQLPSVGPGDVLGALIRSGAAPVSRLTQVFRQSEGSRILEVAHAVRAGRWDAVENGPSSDVFFIEAADAEAVVDVVGRVVTERIPKRFGLRPSRDIQVLVPMHGGAAGSEALNRALQARLTGGSGVEGGPIRPNVGDRVIQTRNDYDLEVFNGDIGVVTEVQEGAQRIRVDFEGREVGYGGETLRDLELAYAISVHKSQGSEFEAVVLVLTNHHFRMLSRSILYTAVTRARRLLVLVGQSRAFKMAAEDVQGRARMTLLSSRVQRLRG